MKKYLQEIAGQHNWKYVDEHKFKSQMVNLERKNIKLIRE